MSSRRAAALLALGLGLAYVVTGDYGNRSVDSAAAEAAAWHLGVFGTPWLEHVHTHNPWFVAGAHGHLVSNRFPGVVLVGVPFYALLGRWSTDAPPTAPGAVCAAVVTAAAMAVLYLALRRRFDDRVALGGALALGLATPTWAVSAGELWTHGPAQLCFAAALLQLARQRSPAVPLGLAVLVRPHLVLVGATVALAQLLRRDRRGALLTVLGIGVASVLYLLWNRWLYGHWTLFGSYTLETQERSHVWRGLPGLPLALISPQRGLFVLTPVLLVLVPELRRAWRAEPWWSRAAATGGLVSLLFNIWLTRASGGDSFYGYRLPLESLLLATPLLIRSWTLWCARGRWQQNVAGALLAVSAGLSAVGAVLYAPSGDPGTPWRSFDPWRIGQDQGVLPPLTVFLVASLVTALLLARSRERGSSLRLPLPKD